MFLILFYLLALFIYTSNRVYDYVGFVAGGKKQEASNRLHLIKSGIILGSLAACKELMEGDCKVAINWMGGRHRMLLSLRLSSLN